MRFLLGVSATVTWIDSTHPLQLLPQAWLEVWLPDLTKLILRLMLRQNLKLGYKNNKYW